MVTSEAVVRTRQRDEMEEDGLYKKKKKKREERSADEAFCVCHLPHPTLRNAHIWDTEERKAPNAKLRRPRGVEMEPFERVVQAVTMLLCDGADPKPDVVTGTDPRSDLGRPRP